MSQRRSSTSTLLVVLLALVVLAALAGFALLDRVSSDGAEDASGHDGTSDADGGLPEGFQRIPDEVFFERVYGAQRAAGSWHLHQEEERDGQPYRALDASTELTGEGTNSDNEFSECCTEANEVVQFQIRVVDGVYYVEGMPSEKPWWKVDPTAGAKQLGIAQGMDPFITQKTDAEGLQEAAEEISLVGPDNIDGVPTAHYRVTLSAEPPSGAPEDVAPTDSRATIDFWVDSSDRPVQVVLTAEAGEQKIVKTSRYSRYGEDLDITAPPAGQTTTKVPDAPVPQQQSS